MGDEIVRPSRTDKLPDLAAAGSAFGLIRVRGLAGAVYLR
jgi:hypothetical protein